jgi:mannose-6-phosphate isomerase class I
VQVSADTRNICTSEFFVLNELTVDSTVIQEADGKSFHVLFCAESSFKISYRNGLVEHVGKGESVLIPAALGAYEVQADDCTSVLKVSVPV